jgi:hypothetical protein
VNASLASIEGGERVFLQGNRKITGGAWHESGQQPSERNLETGGIMKKAKRKTSKTTNAIRSAKSAARKTGAGLKRVAKKAARATGLA